MTGKKVYSCDVLVVGGGIAACFAAIKAAEAGADVILVDKGFAGKSGQSPHAEGFMVYNPDWGHDIDVCMEEINRTSEYVNNRYWTRTVLENSYARFQDLISYGCTFKKYSDGNYMDDIIPAVKGQQQDILFDMPQGKYVTLLRAKVLSLGVKIIDDVMIVELLKQDDRIAGAAGLRTQSEELYVFQAGATILCVGACSFKPIGYTPLTILTCDGEAMAYRAGAEILGKEFVDVHSTPYGLSDRKAQRRFPVDAQVPPPRRFQLDENGNLIGTFNHNKKNALGEKLGIRPKGASFYSAAYLENEFCIHAGAGPVYDGENEMYGGAALGMSLRKADGLWPADKNCRSSLPGLYAAGDSLGTMQNGSVYSSMGGSTAGCAVTGAIAGTAAAEAAKSAGNPTVDSAEVSRALSYITAPMKRKSGYDPRWVIEVVQNLMRPYFVSYIKKEDRLLAVITLIEFVQAHIVPMMYARDPHELRLAHEAANIALSAEMRLRSALFRTESRGTHYREDYPERDDENWLAWTKIRQTNGRMELIKVPVPNEWRPDRSLSYREKYPFPFPGEHI